MKNRILVISLILLFCFLFGCQNKAEKTELEKFRTQAKVEEQNLALIKQEMEAWDKGDFNALRKIVAPEYHLYVPSRSTKPYSIEEEIEWVKESGNPFPDMSLNIEELFAKGDKVVLRYVCRGTHTGEFEGIAATGKQVEYGGVIIFRIENGKIVETREDNDFFNLRQQVSMELKPKQAEKNSGSVEQELIRLENGWIDALVEHDWAFIDRILADDYTTTDSDGVILNKAQEMAVLKSGEEAITHAVADDFKVRVYEDAAVVTFRWTYKGQVRGKESTGQERYTDTWVKRDGRWQCVAIHGSKIAQKQ